jgi:toxin secretion/phage lysis holin
MDDVKEFIPSHNMMICSSAVGIIGTILSKIFGEWNDLFLALIVLISIDFITGVLVAAFFQKSRKSKNGGLNSQACLRGIAKKIGIILLVAVGYQLQIMLGGEYPIKTFVTIGLCTSEVFSIIENTVQMGILPKQVQKILEKAIGLLNDKTNNKE